MKILVFISILAASFPAAWGASGEQGHVPVSYLIPQMPSHGERFSGFKGKAERESATLPPAGSLFDLVWLQEDRPSGPEPGDHGEPMPPPPGPRLWRRGGHMPPPPGPMMGRRRGPMLPPPLLQKLKDLPPDEQEKVLQNNERFQALPKERQEQLIEQLHRWQALPPEQKEAIEQRFAVFSRLTPEQRQKAREIYRLHWRTLPPERRKALMGEFRKLREMSPAEREKYLSGNDLEARFNSEDLDLLKQLSAFPGPPRPRPDFPPPPPEPRP
jgi:hypothetical protein